MKHDAIGMWTNEEDTFLLRLVDRHGTSWRMISKSLPTRSASSMRNRYQRILNGLKQTGTNRCHKCGMIKRGHICGGVQHTSDDDDGLPLGPDTESPPWVSTEFRLDVDEDVTDGEEEEEGSCHLFSWHTVQTANDMGFDAVTHPPPLVKGFPFVTSLP